MKRILICLLALILLLSTVLVSCKKEPDDPEPENGGESTPLTKEDNTFKKTENYMPAEVFSQLKTYFEGTTTGFEMLPLNSYAPFVGSDMYALSGSTVKSITIPVISTRAADEDGNFTFSMYTVSNDSAKIRTELIDPGEPIVVKINAEEYGLSENSPIRKFIKVDLSEYEISLSEDKTLAFSHKDDSIVPACVLTTGTVEIDSVKQKYVPAKYMIDNWGVVGYYYYDAQGTVADQEESATFSYSDNSLFFDFELERTYESEAAYNALLAEQAQADADYAAKLAAVKAAYAGKSLSLMGDSISTYNGISNKEEHGLASQQPYSKYALSGAMYSYTHTYWGNLAAQTDMELCVINSWGAGKVYGSSKWSTDDNMLLRSYNLATSGESPDLILLSYGINDMSSSPSSAQDTSKSAYSGNLPTGNLYQRLTAENKTKTDKEIVAEWFAEVQIEASNAGFDPTDPTTITFENNKSNIYSCWEAAYALSLQNIKRLYSNAEVFCISLPDRNHSSSEHPRLDRANLLIKALAEYFEVGFVDQSHSGVTRENGLMYGCDGTGLHPNARGHAALTKVIVEALYEKLPKN